jgi:hypothetical protein
VETYREAAKEHLGRAQWLFDRESYFLAHYSSGLAIECHLKARILRRTNGFESRHNLSFLMRESQFESVIPKNRFREFSAIFSGANQRWRNNQRFCSEQELLDSLTNIRSEKIKSERTKPGGRWLNFSHTLLNYAYEIINLGERQWNSV